MKVAVAHYPEGAGHATRMLAIARELEARGAAVTLAGGGPGRRFVELLGYEEYVPTPVDFVGEYQGAGGDGNDAVRGTAAGLLDVVTGSVPAAARRVRDYVGWLRREDPDAVVTDDMFAAMAAPVARVPLYVCTHNTPGLYRDAAERWGAAALTRMQVAAAREFFYPAVWDPLPGDPAGVTRVPPVALDAPVDADPDVDVLVSPSTYSTALETAADRLRERGRDVTVVGGPDWEPTASLLPYVEAASVVVCPGYSTAMEAAAAGTPCVVYPFTSEQEGVARFVEAGGPEGFRVARSPDAVVRAVEDPPAAEPLGNGAPVVAAAVLERER